MTWGGAELALVSVLMLFAKNISGFKICFLYQYFFYFSTGSTLCSYELQPSEYTTDPRAAKLCPKYPVPER